MLLPTTISFLHFRKFRRVQTRAPPVGITRCIFILLRRLCTCIWCCSEVAWQNGRWEVKWDNKGLTCWLAKMGKKHRAANFFAWLSYICRLVSFCIPPIRVWIKLWVVDSNQEVSRNHPTDVFQNGALPSASTSPSSRRPARLAASDQVGSGRTVTCYLCAAAPTLALSWRVASPPESEHWTRSFSAALRFRAFSSRASVGVRVRVKVESHFDDSCFNYALLCSVRWLRCTVKCWACENTAVTCGPRYDCVICCCSSIYLRVCCTISWTFGATLLLLFLCLVWAVGTGAD